MQLRAAAVSALGGLNDPEAQRLAVSYLEDPAAAVKAGAVNACRGMKLTSVQDKVAAFLSNPEPALRFAAAKYLAAFPSEMLDRP